MPSFNEKILRMKLSNQQPSDSTLKIRAFFRAELAYAQSYATV